MVFVQVGFKSQSQKIKTLVYTIGKNDVQGNLGNLYDMTYLFCPFKEWLVFEETLSYFGLHRVPLYPIVTQKAPERTPVHYN